MPSILHGEFVENAIRKEYTVTERIAIVEALRSFGHGDDRRSHEARKVAALTIDEAAKRAGLGGKDGYTRAKTVKDKGIAELQTAMDSGDLSIAAASKLARLQPEKQRQVLRGGTDHAIWFANRILKRTNSTSTPEYSTPQWLFDHLDAEFHFTLDVAALPESASAPGTSRPRTTVSAKAGPTRRCGSTRLSPIERSRLG